MFHALPIRILIADDHLFIREGLAAVLGRQPDMKIVAQAADGEEAINLFRLCRPDVSLMDLRMPGIDGIEATRTICEEFPLACILLFTTYCDNTEVASVLRAGAKGHLLKESSCEELLSTIRSVHSTA